MLWMQVQCVFIMYVDYLKAAISLVFLDLPKPWEALQSAKTSLKVPTLPFHVLC